MAGFRFRLHTLHRLRESVRDERRSQLADALRVDATLEEQQEKVQTELKVTRASQRAPVGVVNVDRILQAQRYELMLQSELSAIEQQRKHVAQEIDARRQALMEADRDVKVLEKLEETQRTRWQADQQRREQLALDEAAVMGHFRRVTAEDETP
jgi:flagellar export protein FliJ